MWRISLTQKIEQRWRSTDVDIHKSWDSLYLSCAFLIFYLSKAFKLMANLFKQFQQNLLCSLISRYRYSFLKFKGFFIELRCKLKEFASDIGLRSKFSLVFSIISSWYFSPYFCFKNFILNIDNLVAAALDFIYNCT